MRSALRSTKVLAAICSVVIVLANLGAIAAAVQVGPGTLGGFEIDGDFTVGVGGTTDWTNVSPRIFVPDDTADSGFTQGSKELKPSSWVCGTGGANPNKGNILRAYVGSHVTSGGAFVDLGFVAQNISGQGDVHLNFEFNQSGTAEDPGDFEAGDCSIPRAAGDLLVTYDYPGGDVLPTVGLYKWEPAATPDGNHDGDWVDQNLDEDAAKAAVNGGSLTDPIGGGSVDAERFGEAAIDLQVALGTDAEAPCSTFGHVNVRSRSSGESITSAIQDKLPTSAVDLSTCGSVLLHKVDDHAPAQALAGAHFGLFDNDVASGDPVATCTSEADGTCTIDGVDPGDYWAKEIAPFPAGHSPDPDVVPVTVEALMETEVATAFVDPRDTGSIRIVKKLADDGAAVVPDDASDLDGASFVVYEDANHNNAYNAGEEAKLWPAGTADATCTIAGGDGRCDVGPLPTGTYRVHELTAPPGTEVGPDVGPVAVTKDARVEVDYTNTLSDLNIDIQKTGKRNDDVADAITAHLGDAIHYSFAVSTSGPKLHDISLEEVAPDRCDGSIAGPAKTGGNADDFLETGETWTYGCDHVVTADDPDPLPNKAEVSGTDDFGRGVTDDDTFSVDIIHPAITIEKTASPATVEPGQSTTYTYVVTNTGDIALTNVAVTDDVLGPIGTVAELAPGASTTLGKSVVIAADSPRTNIGNVCGVDPLNLEVCDTDSASISIVLPVPPQHRTPPAPAPRNPTLPHTGFRLFVWIAIGIELVAAGMAMTEVQRRRRRA